MKRQQQKRRGEPKATITPLEERVLRMHHGMAGSRNEALGAPGFGQHLLQRALALIERRVLGKGGEGGRGAGTPRRWGHLRLVRPKTTG